MGRPKKTPEPISTEPLEKIINYIPSPWNEIIETILSRDIKLLQQANEGQSVLIEARVRAWRIALDWLIKWEWNYKHKIPAKRSIANSYQAKGRLLQAIFRLCERCHAFQASVPEVVIPYPNAAYWFGFVFREFILHEVHSAFYPTNEPKKGAKKAAVIKERQELVRKHKNFENPLPTDCMMEATYKLFEIAGRLAQNSPNFKRNYWDKFIQALEGENKQLDTPGFERLFVEDGKAYIQNAGPGRGKIYIHPSPYIKEYMKNSKFIIHV
ncbi:MAG: hypothetical protein FWK04_26220 [Nostoc sp. GBBB01]|nr:hypothetical protein [Nostoc sp. GBBB01]